MTQAQSASPLPCRVASAAGDPLEAREVSQSSASSVHMPAPPPDLQPALLCEAELAALSQGSGEDDTEWSRTVPVTVAPGREHTETWVFDQGREEAEISSLFTTLSLSLFLYLTFNFFID